MHAAPARLFGLFSALTLFAAACAPAAPTPAPTAVAKVAATPAAVAPTAAAAAQPAASAAAARPASGPPVKLGWITALSGPAQVFGEMHRIAGSIAVDKINAEGGINGSPLEIMYENGELAPPQGVAAIRKLAEQDGVFGLVGPISSGQWEVGVPLVNQLEIPAINVNATKSGIASPPWAFRLVGVDDDMVPVGIRAFRDKNPGVKRVVIVGDVREASSEFAVNTSYPAALKANQFDIVETIGFPTGTTDFSPIVTRIKGLNPEGLAISVFLAEGLALQKELEAQGVKVPTFVSPILWAFPFANLATDAANGWMTIGYYDAVADSPRPEGRAMYEEFVRRAAPVAGIPKPVNVANAPIGHDAVLLYAKVMRDAGITAATPVKEARTKIRDGLRGMKNFQGAGWTYKEFKPDGDVVLDFVPLVVDKPQRRWAPQR